MLLVVCLAARDGRGVRYLAGGLAAFAAIFALSYALAPRLTIEFFQSIPKNYGESGRLNPASLPLVTDAASLLERTSHVVVPQALQLIAYLAIAVAVAVPTWMAAARIARSGAANGLELVFYLAAIVQPLVLPRFKNYSYMLLIAPTWFIATRSTHLRSALPLRIPPLSIHLTQLVIRIASGYGSQPLPCPTGFSSTQRSIRSLCG